MKSSTTSSDGNKLILKKLESWNQPLVIRQWVNDKVEDESLCDSQRAHLKKFWDALIAHHEPNKFHLLQCVWALLSFPDLPMPLIKEIEGIRDATKGLHPVLRSHIQLRLVEEFPSISDSSLLLSHLDTQHDSFKSYWGKVFEIISMTVLIHSIALGLYQKNINTPQVALLSEQLQRLSHYFYQLDVPLAYDVMDSVSLIDSWLIQETFNKEVSSFFGIDKETIESTPYEMRSLIHGMIKRAYTLMPSYFEHYEILGAGFRLSQSLVKKLKDYGAELERGVTRFEACLNVYRRLRGEKERTAQIITKEGEFIQKLLFLNQTGCLNLSLLSQSFGENPNFPLHCSAKTKTLYETIQEELKQGLKERAKGTQNELTVGMDAHHFLLRTLTQELNEGAIIVQAPRKATPANSPALGKYEQANEGASSPPPPSPYVSREAKCQHLFHAKTRKNHVHSRTSAIAQKQELRHYLVTHLQEGTLTLFNLEKQVRQLCCVFWKVGSRESFMHRFIPSRMQLRTLSIEHYAQEELARMAGSQGHQESTQAREKHKTKGV